MYFTVYFMISLYFIQPTNNLESLEPPTNSTLSNTYRTYLPRGTFANILNLNVSTASSYFIYTPFY